MTYREQLAARETGGHIEYLSNAEYRKQKAALTRAENSGDPEKVLRAVEKALAEWRGKAWPDDWARWRNALEEASRIARRNGFLLAETPEEADRWSELDKELWAAMLVLFP
jgi:hypothetical protein